ncbi:MAG: hypothetical protein L6Q40_07465 [Azonexus sp.]|nr:hypothetical protein [Azonexus sp.]
MPGQVFFDPLFQLGDIPQGIWTLGLVSYLQNRVGFRSELSHDAAKSPVTFREMRSVTRVVNEVGGIGLVVNAKHSAIEFYQKFGFEQMEDHPQNLFLPI